MSDSEFWLVSISTLVFLVVVLGVYVMLRSVGRRYADRMQKIRVMYATYSIPILLALIFGLSIYHDKMGYVCDAGGNNTGGWKCDFE